MLNVDEVKKHLRNAIDSHLEIKIYYQEDGEFRIVRPYHYGRNGEEEQLHAFQVSGASVSGVPEGWKNYSLSKIRKIDVTKNGFNPPDAGYNQRTKYRKVEYQIQNNGKGYRP